MEKKINVLVYPCGSEAALEVHWALKDVVNIKLFGASGKEDHGKFVYRNYVGDVPYIGDKAFFKVFNSLIKKYKIDVIIPLHDDVTLFLAENIESINAKVATPGSKQARISRSKKLTYDLFKEEEFCPKTFTSLEEVDNFPVFVKPDKGQGGKGSFIVDKKDVERARENLEETVIVEYLPGEEFTVDCFTNRHGELLFVGPRKRHRVEAGISRNTFTVELDDEIKDIAMKISKAVNMRGLWFFQLKRDLNGKLKLLEIAVRTAGTMNLYRGLGVNFPLLTVYDMLDIDVDIIKNDYYLEVDRALFNKYKSTLKFKMVYIDFDDTIIKEGRTNPFVMQFLYYMRNDKKKIKLITRHKGNIKKTLLEYSISEKLFDEIIVLKDNQVKSDFIKEKKDVIFIDNSFKERAQVKRELKIPVFDVDAINTLINWRE
jgi:hypothetical protein